MTWSSFADQELLVQLTSENQFSLKQINTRQGKSGFEYFIYEIAAL
jgi:hypothetical protein